MQTNTALIEGFVGRPDLTFAPDDGHADRTPHQRHEVVRNVPLQAVYDELLAAIRITDFEDSQRWIAGLVLIDKHLTDHPDAECTVYRMRPGIEYRRQVRDGAILNLFQGAHPDRNGAIYPGDRRLHDDPVTIHLHQVTLIDGPVATGALIRQHVPLVAFWMSPEIIEDVVVQPQGGD